jgi:vacuolar-type H+-ATPase subunit I/STV1
MKNNVVYVVASLLTVLIAAFGVLTGKLDLVNATSVTTGVLGIIYGLFTRYELDEVLKINDSSKRVIDEMLNGISDREDEVNSMLSTYKREISILTNRVEELNSINSKQADEIRAYSQQAKEAPKTVSESTPKPKRKPKPSKKSDK